MTGSASGVFKPYAAVSTAILFFTKTNSGGTENVWFYDVQADGLSLDDKREPVEQNDLSDVLERWKNLDAEQQRARTEQSFIVSREDIIEHGYDFSINRYKEIEFAYIEHRAPLEIIGEIEELDAEITGELAALKAVLNE